MNTETLNTLTFYRGGGPLMEGCTAYFTTSRSLASHYGPVTEHGVTIRNPKFVDELEWMTICAVPYCYPERIAAIWAGGHDAIVFHRATRSANCTTILCRNGYASTGGAA